MTYYEQYYKIKCNFDVVEWDVFARKLLMFTNYNSLLSEYKDKLNIKHPYLFLRKLCVNLDCLKKEVLRLNAGVFKEELFIYVWNDSHVECLQNYVAEDCAECFFTERHVEQLCKGLIDKDYVLKRKDAQFYIDLRKMGLVKFIK